MKVLKSIVSTLLAVFVIVALVLLAEGITKQKYRNALDEAMQKRQIYYEDITSIPSSSIAQEIYYVTQNNATVNFDAYYDNLSHYDTEKLPDFLNPTNMFLEYLDGKWDGSCDTKNHTIVFDDGSVIRAEMQFDNVLHVNYDDGFAKSKNHNFYFGGQDHHYNLYVLPDGTKISGGHNAAAFGIEVSGEYSGCIAFEHDKVFIAHGSRVDTYPLGFDFDDAEEWSAFGNGVFVFVVKNGNGYQLWECIRGESTLIEESETPITLDRKGLNGSAYTISAYFADHYRVFSRNGNSIIENT